MITISTGPLPYFLRVFVVAACSWTWTVQALDVPPFESYSDAFVNPDVVLAGHYNITTSIAQITIQSWATQLAAEGPWSESWFGIPRLEV
jgi:hypothetical protein